MFAEVAGNRLYLWIEYLVLLTRFEIDWQLRENTRGRLNPCKKWRFALSVQIYSQTREGQVNLDLYFNPGSNVDQAVARDRRHLGIHFKVD